MGTPRQLSVELTVKTLLSSHPYPYDSRVRFSRPVFMDVVRPCQAIAKGGAAKRTQSADVWRGFGNNQQYETRIDSVTRLPNTERLREQKQEIWNRCSVLYEDRSHETGPRMCASMPKYPPKRNVADKRFETRTT
eukprot:9333252-Pyramimonas_sp.AAC.1